MLGLLELPEIRECLSPLSVAEYHLLGEYNQNGRRTELLRGIVIEKRPKAPLHCFMTGELCQILAGQIGRDFSLFCHNPLSTADSEPEPDVMIVRGHPGDFCDAHPATAELVIEVAVASPAVDRAKAAIYAEAAVREYWIVRPVEKLVEVYREPTSNGYADVVTIAAPARLECAALPAAQVDLGALFV